MQVHASEHNCRVWLLRNLCSGIIQRKLRCGVTGLKDVLYDERDPAEECFHSLHCLLAEKKAQSCENTHCAPPQIMPRSRLCAEIFCVPLGFTLPLLPPSLGFAFAPVLWHVATSQLVLVQHFYRCPTQSSAWHKGVAWRKTDFLFFSSVLLWQSKCCSHRNGNRQEKLTKSCSFMIPPLFSPAPHKLCR